MRWFWVFIWTGIIVFLSFLPANNLPSYDIFDLLKVDKWVHVFFYYIYAFLLFRALGARGYFFLKALMVPVYCIGFGYAIEVFQQKFTSTRQFEWLDILFDAVGVVFYSVLWLRKIALDFKRKS